MAKTPEIDLRENFGRNYIINGNFDFWQRGISFSIGGGAAYTEDRFLAQEGGTGGFDVLRSSDTPSINSEYSLDIDITTAGALAAGDVNILEHRLEGYNFRDIVDKYVTLSFYVKSNVTGTHSVAFQNLANDRSYVSEYTIDSADTWELKSITLLLDSTGSWEYTNGTGLRMRFSIGVGSTFTTSTLDQWQAGDFRASTGHSNIKASDTNYIRFSQIQLIEGVQLLPFRRAGKTYAEELMLCERYYEKDITIDVAPGGSFGGNFHHQFIFSDGTRQYTCGIPMRTRKRANPTVFVWSNSGTDNAVTMRRQGVTNNSIPASATEVLETSFVILADASSDAGFLNSDGAAYAGTAHWTADAEL